MSSSAAVTWHRDATTRAASSSSLHSPAGPLPRTPRVRTCSTALYTSLSIRPLAPSRSAISLCCRSWCAFVMRGAKRTSVVRSVSATVALVVCLVALVLIDAHGENVISSSRSIDGTVYTYTLQDGTRRSSVPLFLDLDTSLAHSLARSISLDPSRSLIVGEESLRVSGPLPEGFVIDKVMHDFRSALDVASDTYGGGSFTHTFTYRQANVPTTSPTPSSQPSGATTTTTTTPPASAPQRAAQARSARTTPEPAVLEPLTPPASSSSSSRRQQPPSSSSSPPPPPSPPIPTSAADRAGGKYRPHYPLWNDADALSEDDMAPPATSDKAGRSKSLIEALSDFIATTPLARMQQYFSYYGTVFRSKERQEELQVVRDEFYSVEYVSHSCAALVLCSLLTEDDASKPRCVEMTWPRSPSNK